MKFIVLTALTALLAALAAAAPNPIAGELRNRHALINPISETLFPRTGAIKLGLGTQHVNVGSMPSGVLYNSVYKALLHICSSSSPSCSYDSTTFQVKVDNEAHVEAVGVTVEGSQYHANEKMLRLLIGCVAGSVERGTWNLYSCREVKTRYIDRELTTQHCNTVDYVSVEFPGDNFLKVRFLSSKNRGNFDCKKILGYARTYVDTLQPEIKEAVGDADLYMDERCIW